MPVSADVQMAISTRYAQLADSITHGKRKTEASILGPHFVDHGRLKLESFEYDPLTVVVQKITLSGSDLVVHAEYVGVHGHNVTTVDRWAQKGDAWVLISRQ